MRRVAGRARKRAPKGKKICGKELFIAVIILVIVAAFSSGTGYVTLPTAYAVQGWETAAGPLGTYATTALGPGESRPVEKWSIELDSGTQGAPVLNTFGDKIAVYTKNKLWVIPNDGTDPYSRDVEVLPGGSPVWVTSRNLVFVTEKGVSLLDVETKEVKWEKEIKNEVTAHPATYGGIIYVPTKKGLKLVGFDGKDVYTFYKPKVKVTFTPIVEATPLEESTCGEVYKMMKKKCEAGKEHMVGCYNYIQIYRHGCLDEGGLSKNCKEQWRKGTMRGSTTLEHVRCYFGYEPSECAYFFDSRWKGKPHGVENCKKKYSDPVAANKVTVSGGSAEPRIVFVGDSTLHSTRYWDKTFHLGKAEFEWTTDYFHCEELSGKPKVEECDKAGGTWTAYYVKCKKPGKDVTLCSGSDDDWCLCEVESLYKDWTATVTHVKVPPIMMGQKVYVPVKTQVKVYNAETGEMDPTTYDFEKTITAFAIVERALGGVQIAAGDEDGNVNLYWDGQYKTVETEGGKVTSVIIAGEAGSEMVYAGTEVGDVYAINPRDKEKVWDYNVGGLVVDGLAVSGRTLYVAAGKNLIALAGDTVLPSLKKAEPFSRKIGVDESNNWQTFSACVEATDNIGLKSIRINTSEDELDCKDGDEWGTYTVEVSGKSVKKCFECKPKMSGLIKWNAVVEDESGNRKWSTTNTLSVTTKQADDVEPPKCTLELWDRLEQKYVSTLEAEPDALVGVRLACTDDNGYNGGLVRLYLYGQKEGEREKLIGFWETIGATEEVAYGYLLDGTELTQYTLRAYADDGTGKRSEDAFATIKTKDITAPTLSFFSISARNPEPLSALSFKGEVYDNGELLDVSLYINGALEQTAELSGSRSSITFTYDVPDLQGETMTWHIVARDKSYNEVVSEERSFKVADIEPPALVVTNEAEIKESILKGQAQAIEYEVSDNVELDKVELWVNGELHTSYDAYGTSHSSIFYIGPSWYEGKVESYPATVNWYVIAYDESGLASEKVSGQFVIEPPCLEKDTDPPTISGTKMSGEPLPGEELSFTANIKEVGPERCGNLSKAYLELNHTGRPFKVGWKDFPAAAKSADVNFTWRLPESEIESGQFAVVMIAPIIRMPVGLEGVEFVIPPTLAPPASGRVALPGSVIAWRILAEDLAGNSAASPLKIFKVKDAEAPVIINSTGPEQIRMGEVAEFTACVYDWNIKPGKVALEVDEGTGRFAKVAEKKLTKDSGQKECVKFEWSNPALLFGTTVNWRIVATDAEGNSIAGDSEKFLIISHPPQWTDIDAPTRAKRGATITLSKRWTDDNGLKEAILLIDEGTGFEEVDRVKLKGTDDTATFFYTVRLEPGQSFKWSIIGIDIDGNENSTDPEIIIEEDTEPPSWSNMRQSADSVQEGERVTLSVELSDDVGLKYANLQTDEGGEFADVKSVILSGTSGTASFEWFNPLTKEGTKVSWRVVASDINGNKVTTDEKSFLVTARPAPPTCPVTCVGATDWSECIRADGTWEESRLVFTCGPETDYRCKIETEKRGCAPPFAVEPLPVIVVLVILGGGVLLYLRRKGFRFGRRKEKPAEEEMAEQPFK